MVVAKAVWLNEMTFKAVSLIIKLMQITEASLIGLRSAVMILKNPQNRLTIKIVPMVHYADKSFYEEVEKIVLASQFSIQEGVKADTNDLIYDGDLETPFYSNTSPNRLGLFEQPDFSLKGIKILNFDSDAKNIFSKIEFADNVSRWKKALYFFVVGSGFICLSILRLIRFIGSIYTFFNQSRSSLAKNLNIDTTSSNFFDLVNNSFLSSFVARDQNFHSKLGSFLEERKDQECTVSILYGAMHVPTLLDFLATKKYRVTSADWVLVFRL